MKRNLLLIVCSAGLWLSCQQKNEQIYFEKEPVRLVAEALPDTLSLPEVFPITNANAPIPIRINPTRIPLKYPYGVGKPTFTRYGVAEGLPANVIPDLAKDKYGNIWIGGMGYISKFDGTSFTNYPAAAGFGTGFISYLLFDSRGDLWIATFEDLYKFNGQAFVRVILTDSDLQLNITNLVEDNAGDIWVDTHKNGVYRIQEKSISHFTIEQRLDNYRYTIIKSNSGQILAETSKGIYVFDGEEFIPYTRIKYDEKQKNAYILLSDSKGNIWFWNWNNHNTELIRFDGVNTQTFGSKEGFSNQTFIYAMFEDDSGDIWISSANALFRFRDGQFVECSGSAEGGWTGGRAFINDDAGNIWSGGMDGLVKISMNYQNRLEVPGESNEITNIYELTTDKDGLKWVLGNNGNGQALIKYARNEAQVYDLGIILGSKYISKFSADQKGNIWLTVDGREPELICFDGTNFFRYGKVHGVKVTQAYHIFEDRQGDIIVTGAGGMNRFDGKTITYFGPSQGFPDYISTYLSDSKSRKWIGTDNSGLIMMTGDSILRINTKNGLPHNFINVFAEDPYGNIWIGTDGGAVKFDGKKLTGFGMTEGIGKLVGEILPDTINKVIWFGTIAGLVSLPFDEIHNSNPAFTIYSQRNGYELIPAMFTVSQNLLLDSTSIWMPGLNKDITRFDFKRVQKFTAPRLQIRNIRINNTNLLWSLLEKKTDRVQDSLILLCESVSKFGKPVDTKKIKELSKTFRKIEFDSLRRENSIPENLRLPFSNNSITFEFAAISPSFGKYTQYRYKLEGYEENWSPYSTKTEAFFGNMSEGKYTFYLEAITSFGANSKLSYSFSVLPPWYRTWWAYTLYALLFITAVYTFIRWRTKALQKEKVVLEEKVTSRTAELNQSLENLKATQSQLIQSEKMASLGELTAGIAHEIQNPLNFVNNFSEVNEELLLEMKDELDKGNIDDAKAIANDAIDNQQKILHHGKRADAIVKGMLQHSRSSSGVKEPTDINVLADEYLRLAYHGLRAKDKSFNATMKTDFDQSIGKIDIVPQDIGRVILNLITNAFYAVNERLRQAQPDSGYEPTVTVSTKKEGNNILISVKDNGNGIPENIEEKIFQPFFTTKPTGQGTGLGLSMSYDIVTKTHNGEIKVNSKEGEGTEFIVVLPIA